MTFLAGHLDLLLLGAVCVLLMAGFPVAFSLGGAGVLFAFFGYLAGISPSLGAIPLRIYGVVTNEVLIAVPLFIFMGFVLERSKVAEDLLLAMGWLLRGLPGGLGLSVTLVGALLAASTGIVGATVVTMGLLALPTLLKNGYRPSLACGSIAAAGTLGQIIPPSIVLVFLADQLSNAYQSALRDMGHFAPEPFSVADLFAASVLPGLVLVGFYMIYQLFAASRKADRDAFRQQLEATPTPGWGGLLISLVPPLVLIVCVLGSILAGIATPTEAAALGAAGAIVIAGARSSKSLTIPLGLPGLSALVLAGLLSLAAMKADGVAGTLAVLAAIVASLGLFAGLLANLWVLQRNGSLTGIVLKAVEMIAMMFAIMIGATIFSLVFRDLGGDETVTSLLSSLPGGTLGAMLAVMGVMFVLGFFLDFLEIVFVVVPLVAPVLLQMPMADGSLMSPAWLGVMMAVNLQTSFLTPPFGFALFYLRGTVPPSVRTMDIYRGVVPFVAIQLLVLVVIYWMPALATWLPGRLYP
ncbi:TRAP transporter large permease [Roseibium aggregatum]|uniref:TRAP transporter large permease subunit n=1 Tax=Roseibium aggregatum TaxID=187304 RepID=A0A926NXV3_9HYPH|nr:TRAP transporter large permease subunit [Roseibium aggregatum]MBD1548404.1 TRAP transporter large permease subunit [Roseibium aggregatum]